MNREQSRWGDSFPAAWRREGYENRVLIGAFVISGLAHAAFFWGGLSAPHATANVVELDLTQAAASSPPARQKKAASPPRPEPRPSPRPKLKKEWNASLHSALARATTAQAVVPPFPTAGSNAVQDEVFAGSAIAAPRLLNGRELAGLLRRYYPEREREAGVEGKVVMVLHVDPEGRVVRAESAGSGSADFIASARRIALLLRFSPTVVAGRRVPVRLRQAISFQLEQ